MDKRLKYKLRYNKILAENIGIEFQISHVAVSLPIYLLGQGK